MNDTRKAIIELIWDYMEKDLSEGCWVNDTDYDTGLAQIYNQVNRNFIVMRLSDLSKPYIERKTDVEDWEILGHYDLSAVLRYIYDGDTITYLSGDEIRVHISMKHEYLIPNKPLILYTEQEELELLTLLNKLK